MNGPYLVKRCRACSRIGQIHQAPVEECSFCGSRLLEPTGSIYASHVQHSDFATAPGSDRRQPANNVRRIAVCLWSAAALQLISGLLLLSFDSSLIQLGQVASVVGLIAGAIGGIWFLRSVYRAWHQLYMFSPETLRRNGLGSPGLIIGLLFVPLFNLFWLFTAFNGWNRVAAQVLDDHLIAGERPDRRYAFRFCLMNLLSPLAVTVLAAAFGISFGMISNWCFALCSVHYLKSMLEEKERICGLLAHAHPLYGAERPGNRIQNRQFAVHA